MIIIVLIDWEHLIIPNNIILVGIGMGILIFIPSGWETVGLRMLASFICMVFMLSVRLIGNQLLKREAMGFGDVKLASLVGFFLEFQNFLIALWLAAILGTMYGIVKHVQRKKQQIPVTNHPTEISFKLPFGSFLAFASVIVIIFQEQIQNLIDSWLIFNL
jgi:leader peptidase (prepilin peptidase)/N-methyltransferase